ncbi:intradiol ring-cleavage dioxygenase [Nocardioides panzhihuensis]|uniref:Protocatechuate 3,4-dioxygenase beta subunit n=1 Tax=Nocardioides panzhihuensis TaxID=860243 RepID=A0A7Z0DNJ9_9ACTN|nr:intradiol ring-cleavage dioxygenase [Nocardioides panzhihuensis]NYI78492.1 protocatechuate 3,4-dioxygenase beta subunit [Nocardioides panzhihuensis]
MSRVPEPEKTIEGPAYEGRLLPRPEEEVVDQGAGFDVTTLLTRRRILGLVGAGVGAAALAACGSASSSSSGSSSGSAATTDGEIPQETNGPYPADGTNGTNVLTESGIVRSDITTSLDGGTTVDGVPLAFTFTVTDMTNDDVPFEGVAVYLWQCDALGRYSMYSEGVENETYLRGVQVADAKGQVTFKTIVPGCYDGRWTHMHFEVYPDADSATTGENAIATSQVAFPEEMLTTVYQDDAYEGSAENLNKVSLDTDNVFSDGYDLEMGTFTGNPSAGYRGSLAVAVDTTTEAAMGGAPSGGAGGTPPEPPTQ